MDMQVEREIWLDWMRVAACLMVMVVHSTEPFYLADGSAYEQQLRGQAQAGPTQGTGVNGCFDECAQPQKRRGTDPADAYR
jgi:peptidoglycan/LPS O-acetylase OafA/YrhL